MSKKKSLVKSSKKESRQLNLMTVPVIVWYALFCYLPLFGIAFAFKEFTPVPGESLFENLFVNSRWVGFRNFSYIFRNPQIRSIILNTLLYNVIFLIAGIIIPVFLAILLSEVHQKSIKGLVQMTLVLPYFISWVIVGYCVYGFLSTDTGLFNSILQNLGFDKTQWYQSPQYWRVILIILGIWKSSGYIMVIYLCSITAIDRTLYESASLDGASFFQRVRYITLPHLKTTISTLFILGIGSILSSDFGLFYQVPMDSGALQEVTQTLDVYVYKSLMQDANFSYSSAAAFLQSAVGCVLLIVANVIVSKMDKESALV
ncbi:MAG: sugar ABC transporter permease [Lachnospiraceae bacterium]|nr:sugar ABC transporter permease [Lachnospiraceae bacterium]